MCKHHSDKAKTWPSFTFSIMHWANATSLHPPIWFIRHRSVSTGLQPRRGVRVAFSN